MNMQARPDQEKKKESLWLRFGRHARQRTFTGLMLLLPIVITVFFLRIVFAAVSGFLAPALDRWLGAKIPDTAISALAVLVLVVGLYLVGIIATQVFARRLIAFGESILLRVPLVKAIYSPAKKAVELLALGDKAGLKSVVLVEFPRPGFKAVGFVTGALLDPEGRKCLKVFIPNTPNPTTGFIEIVPAEMVQALDMSVEDGIKMIVSCGILSPDRLVAAAPRPEHAA